jgi:hypothetical protein
MALEYIYMKSPWLFGILRSIFLSSPHAIFSDKLNEYKINTKI